MASPEDMELVRRIHAAMQANNMIAMLELVDRNVEWVQPMGMPGASMYRGHEGIRQQAHSWAGTWDSHELEPLDFEEAGDKVLVHCRQRAKGRMSGVEVEADVWALWTLEDGRAKRVVMAYARDEALAAG